jgi:hypothetical protein
MSDLIERLISRADFFDSLREWDAPSGALEREAADRIASLEAALAPFAEWAEKLDREFGDHPGDTVAAGIRGAFVTFADLRRAASLSSSKQKDGGE